MTQAVGLGCDSSPLRGSKARSTDLVSRRAALPGCLAPKGRKTLAQGVSPGLAGPPPPLIPLPRPSRGRGQGERGDCQPIPRCGTVGHHLPRLAALHESGVARTCPPRHFALGTGRGSEGPRLFLDSSGTSLASSPWPTFFRRRAASSASGPPGPVDCGPRRQPWGSGSY